MIFYLSPVVAIVGLVIFLRAKADRIPEVGKIMFWTGLLATLLSAPAIWTTLRR